MGALSVTGWRTVVDFVLSPFSENVKSSDAPLRFSLAVASSLNELSLCDPASVAILLCAFKFLTSFMNAVRSDQGFCDTQEDEGGCVWSGAPVDGVKTDGDSS